MHIKMKSLYFQYELKASQNRFSIIMRYKLSIARIARCKLRIVRIARYKLKFPIEDIKSEMRELQGIYTQNCKDPEI